MIIDNINVLALAYIGDSVYDLMIKDIYINKGISKVNKLHKLVIHHVCAESQAKYLQRLIEKNILTEREMDIIRRARNNKGLGISRKVDVLTYKHATAFEALIGYLYLTNEKERLIKIVEFTQGDE
jgi:ribonuclease III family protein